VLQPPCLAACFGPVYVGPTRFPALLDIVLRLLTFGGLAVRNGAVINGVANPRSRLAILAVLAVAGDRGIRREKLAAMFWPDSDEERARSSLRQALFILKRDIGAGEITTGVADLRLNPSVLTADVIEFDNAIREGRVEDAASLYAGPFLDGVYLRESPEFERWAEEQRRRFSSEYGRALERAAQTAASKGEHQAALKWLEKLSALDPLSGRVARLYMEGMERAGEREKAIRHAASHAYLIKQELEADPDAGVLELAERLKVAGRASLGTEMSVPEHSMPAEVQELRLTTPGTAPAASKVNRYAHRAARAALAVAATALVVFVISSVRSRLATSAVPPSNAVLVVPFDVDAADSAHRHLREGIVALLGTRLAGVPSMPIVEPAAALSAWRYLRSLPAPSESERTRTIALRVGAGRLLQGTVVGSRSQLVISASITPLDSGAPPVQATVTTASDNLSGALDKLAAMLLASSHGESMSRLPSIATAPLPAVKAYLAGQVAYRRGDYARATDLFREALDSDSTFALAGLRLALAVGLAGQSDTLRNRGLSRAWKARDQLIAMDRAFVEALATGRLPEAPVGASDAESRWERAVSEGSDWPEVWNEYGDILFHQGRGIDHQSAISRAAAALRRAHALDSTFAPVIPHLLQIEAQVGDTAAVRRLARIYLSRDSTSSDAQYVRWRLAFALGDDALVRQLHRRMPQFTRQTLRSIVQSAIFDGVGVSFSLDAAAAMIASAGSDEERYEALLFSHEVALVRGEKDGALAAIRQIEAQRPRTGEGNRLRVLDALYGAGDSIAAVASALALAASAATPIPKHADRSLWIKDVCVLAQWQLHSGDVDGSEQSLHQLLKAQDPPRPADGITRNERSFCAAMLSAMISSAAGRRDLRARLVSLDSTTRTASSFDAIPYYHLVRARLYSASGDTSTALRAVRQRFYFAFSAPYLPAHLLEEARLAGAVGDTTGAVHALRHYLKLRVSGSREVEREVARAHAALVQLGTARP
jgi:DNA-binding SARP family transcriptional activator